MKLAEGLPDLRHPRFKEALRRCLAGKNRSGFRLIQFSIQPNHLHLVVEAKDETALSRGVKGLATPREVRNALAYVRNNVRKHRTRWPEPPWRF